MSEYRKLIDPEKIVDISGVSRSSFDEKGENLVELSGSWRDVYGSGSFERGKKGGKIVKMEKFVCPRCKKERFFVKKRIFGRLMWLCTVCNQACETENKGKSRRI